MKKLFFAFSVLLTAYGLQLTAAYSQESAKLTTLTKEFLEAKSEESACVSCENLKNLYFTEHKYNEFVELLKSLAQQKKTLEPAVNYCIGLARYAQLKYLEEAQGWDEYFAQGNAYRDELTASLDQAVKALPASAGCSLYARLLLFKFHKGQQDDLVETALTDLVNAALAYAKEAKDIAPIKAVADQLLADAQKPQAKELYRIYVEKISTSGIKDEELKAIAAGFYKEGNIDLAEAVYDLYLGWIKDYKKEKLVPILSEIAQLFAAGLEGAKDADYAEKIFSKIEGLGGKEVFTEELIYTRAFNLEKLKEYAKAKDWYLVLARQYPQSPHADEASFKIAVIYTYILRDLKTGRDYFGSLTKKETSSPHTISALYQLGLLSQWEGDPAKAKEYYDKLLALAGDGFPETSALTKERLSELTDKKPLENNLKKFLDLSLQPEYADFSAASLDLQSSPYKSKKDEQVTVGAATQMPQSGCMQVVLDYLWSGNLGESQPVARDSTFMTQYAEPGTKIIGLIVVSPSGIVGYTLDLLDVE